VAEELEDAILQRYSDIMGEIKKINEEAYDLAVAGQASRFFEGSFWVEFHEYARRLGRAQARMLLLNPN
jgi:hypothetical protein